MGKTKELLAYLIQHYTSVSITGLMKLAYISDLVSIQKNKDPISDFEYIRYKYGPFDNKIYTYIQELLYDQIILEEPAYTQQGDEYIIYKFNELSSYLFTELNDKEKIVANEVVNSLRGYGAKSLVDLAYRTKPMIAIGAKQGNEEGLNEKLNLWAS